MTIPVSAVTCFAVPNIPLIKPGDDLAALMIEALARSHYQPQDQDVFVVSQKVVSKAQNRYVRLSSVTPSPEANTSFTDMIPFINNPPRADALLFIESKGRVAPVGEREIKSARGDAARISLMASIMRRSRRTSPPRWTCSRN